MSQTVICGDSRYEIPDEDFDLVITSPPYNVGVEYDDYDDQLSLGEWRALVTTVLREAWDRLAPGGRLCVNVQHGVGRSPMIPIGFHVEGIGHNLPGAMYRGAVVWSKGPVNTTAWGSYRSPSNPVLRGTYEMVYVWSKEILDRPGPDGDLSGAAFSEATLDTWTIPAVQNRSDHPAPFPVELAERVIRLYTWPGDRVLDPFCGIGSSGVAAARSGRAWTGLDISPTYCDIAHQRIASAHTDHENALDEPKQQFAHELAETLAAGAHAGGQLEVRRIVITTQRPWETYRRTLSNQVTEGAYAVVRRNDGSRVCWTTSSSQASLQTLRRWSRKPVRTIRGNSVTDLEEQLYEDAVGVLGDAPDDRRARSITRRVRAQHT